MASSQNQASSLSSSSAKGDMLMRPPRVPHNRKRKAPDALEEHKPSRRMMAVVSYDGTDWSGWQTQSHGRTIQDSLEARLSGLLRVQTTIAGAGRTDAGVHAKAQVGLRSDGPPPPSLPSLPPPPVCDCRLRCLQYCRRIRHR
mmetsp:Transcript_8849/g.15944  ORF Transcript_8849/g.15944 Transcript_8849/m.15944 type:complete len:143 (-) Transcript_8849:375-803(-)